MNEDRITDEGYIVANAFGEYIEDEDRYINPKMEQELV